jgi:hypothetical protein
MALTTPIPVRCDGATLANLETIIASGLASDRSAAFRAGAAALARAIVDTPVVWAVIVGGLVSTQRLFATEAAARAWIKGNATDSLDCDIEAVVLQ